MKRFMKRFKTRWRIVKSPHPSIDKRFYAEIKLPFFPWVKYEGEIPNAFNTIGEVEKFILE